MGRRARERAAKLFRRLVRLHIIDRDAASRALCAVAECLEFPTHNNMH